MNDDNDQSDFAAEYAAVFYAKPCKSPRGRAHWIDLEMAQDDLAAPLYSVKAYGGCAYVYSRDDFGGVSDPATLRQWLRASHDRLVEGIQSFVPASPEETADHAAMRESAQAIWVLAEKACDIEQARGDASEERR